MADHCEHHHIAADADTGLRSALRKSLAVNLLMFFVEITCGIYSRSLSVVADSMDFLSDSAGFALGLYALKKSRKFRSYFALANAASMFAVALYIIISAYFRLDSDIVPHALTMGSVGMLALVANMLSAWWLYQHRSGDSLQQSFWLCSRNDALNNIAVVIASICVHFTGSHWPDLTIAMVLMALETQSAFKVGKQALKELQALKAGDVAQ